MVEIDTGTTIAAPPVTLMVVPVIPVRAVILPDELVQPLELPTISVELETQRRWLPDEPGKLIASTLTSTLVHVALLLILAFWFLPSKSVPRAAALTINLSDDAISKFDELSSTTISIPDPRPAELLAGPVNLHQLSLPDTSDILLQIDQQPIVPGQSNQKPIKQQPAGSPGNQLPVLGGLNGEGRTARRASAKTIGATDASEAAVERALAWFAAHQRKDGSWRFDHRDGACDGTCGNPGTHAATTASTALVLLSYYGAGYKHTAGPYAETINRGLYYLGGRMLLTPNGGDLQEGSMYAQGIAAIALCEAAAMTDDPTLRGYGERAIQFILYAQDRRGGGWRYHPGEPGDMTVTGWQLMALKSAQMTGIEVHSTVFQDASRFLDSVQNTAGSTYGYRDRQPRSSTTAVGLLCRMYLGWGRDHPALVAGAAGLDKLGPSKNDLYYNYYATQVLMHMGGPEWERWNPKMRDYLVATQAQQGHEAGSWYFPDQHNDQGGRLLSTALATMTLEVYYRIQPLYKNQAAESGF